MQFVLRLEFPLPMLCPLDLCLGPAGVAPPVVRSKQWNSRTGFVGRGQGRIQVPGSTPLTLKKKPTCTSFQLWLHAQKCWVYFPAHLKLCPPGWVLFPRSNPVPPPPTNSGCAPEGGAASRSSRAGDRGLNDKR